MDEEKLTERRMMVVGFLTKCPVCAADMARLDTGPDRTFRSSYDLAAVSFDCGAEFSVDDFGEFISRTACPIPSDNAAEAINAATEAEIEEGEEDETQSV